MRSIPQVSALRVDTVATSEVKSNEIDQYLEKTSCLVLKKKDLSDKKDFDQLEFKLDEKGGDLISEPTVSEDD